jgi:hypothetical protein
VYGGPVGTVKVTDPITITEGDMERLDEGEFLNDNLVDFYLKVLLNDNLVDFYLNVLGRLYNTPLLAPHPPRYSHHTHPVTRTTPTPLLAPHPSPNIASSPHQLPTALHNTAAPITQPIAPPQTLHTPALH